ncbi:MAG TPA: hypothetical protein VGQ37_00840 [Vicinamibacterales bacterium]|jgi:hypothetical protein|nr:hypothetical protein [Vicinamibacterales bacterium]
MRTPLTGALAAGLLIAGAVCVSVLRAQVPAPASTTIPKRPAPRTPWGDPDLQGIWSSDEEAGVPFERPLGQTKAKVNGTELEALLEEREHQRADNAATIGGVTGAGPVHWYEIWGRQSARTSLVVDPADGRVPRLIPEAEQRQQRRTRPMGSFSAGPFERPDDFSLYDRCITRGLPAMMFPAIYNNNTRIVQAPGYVAVTYEMIHETRVIPLDGRPFASGRIRGYLGDARARWDDGALVIETRHFSDKTNYRGAGAGLRLVERFRRSHRGLRYEVTVEDPHTFTRSWTAALNLTPGIALFEYACHEGNYAMRNMLSAARAAEAGGRAVK